MATKRCGVCGNACRSRRASFALKDGSLKSVLACTACQRDAVLLVTAQPAPKCGCGATATSCQRCSDKAADRAKRGAADAKAIAKALRLRAKVYAVVREDRKQDARECGPGEKGKINDALFRYNEGIVVGLEQAADYLERGSW